jgi:hypothetical protein
MSREERIRGAITELGTTHINLEHPKLDRVTNRMVYGILVAALFLGSVVLWAAKVPPMYSRVSVLGLAGLAAAIGFGGKAPACYPPFGGSVIGPSGEDRLP